MKVVERILKIRRAVAFRLDDGSYGSVWTEKYEPRYININIKAHDNRDPVRTFVHECLHILYPDLAHKGIYAMERWVWKRLTPKERFLLSKKLYNRRWRAR
jgi:hypothetical protein